MLMQECGLCYRQKLPKAFNSTGDAISNLGVLHFSKHYLLIIKNLSKTAEENTYSY